MQINLRKVWWPGVVILVVMVASLFFGVYQTNAVSNLRAELILQQKANEQSVQEFTAVVEKNTKQTEALKSTVTDLHEQVGELKSKEASLTSELEKKNKEIKRLQGVKAAAARKARVIAASTRSTDSKTSATAVKYSPSGGVKCWESLVRAYFKTDLGARRALAVMGPESGGDPNAVGPGGRGLMQINPCHATAFKRVTGQSFYPGVFNPRANIQFAAYMTNGGRSWSAWSVKPGF